MLGKLFEKLYNKVYVNIVVEKDKSNVYVKEYSGNKVVKENSRTFDTLGVDKKMREFVNSSIVETPYYYISLLDTSKVQGAIPSCMKHEMKRYADIDSIKYRCYNDEWAYYTSKSELDAVLKNYESFGLDFVFSQFVILRNFFKDRIDKSLALYVLIEENIISVAVFKESRLLYGESLDMETMVNENELMVDEVHDDEVEELDIDSGIDIESIDALDDIESLDDFGNIEDLDSVDDLDEFDESSDNILDDVSKKVDDEEADTEDVDESSVTLNDDYNRFILIQNAINKFYKDSKYESEFIEHVYIADSMGRSTDLKRYLEEEMFLGVYIRRIELGHELCELARMESQ